MKKLLMLTAVIATAIAVRAEVTPINGENGVGFVDVSVPTTENGIKVLSVPFEACLGSGVAGVLRDLVSTNGMKSAESLVGADQLVVLTTNAQGQAVYYYYWYKTGYGWETNNTIRLGTGEPEVERPEDASTFKVARGLGFWLKRASGATGDKLYVKGQVPTSSSPVTVMGGTNFTLIGLGALTTTNLNQVSASEWGTRYDGLTDGSDTLLVVTNANGSYITYTYWGAPDNAWLDTKGNEPTVPILPGEGFWFLRRGAANLTFTPVVSK
jgi:hypothetical protein